MIVGRNVGAGSAGPGPADLMVLLCAYSLFAVQSSGFADDPGVGWHLAAGRVVAETARLPDPDPFLAGPPRRWVSDQWLADLVLWGVYRAGGFPALYASLAVVFLWTFWVVVFRTALASSGSVTASVLATLAAFKCSQIHYILRPVPVAFLLFAYVVSVVSGRPAPLGRRVAVVLGCVFVVWANVHPSFVLGLVVVAVHGASAALGGAASPARAFAPFAAAAACSLVNPWGVGLHLSVAELGGSDFFMRLHEEWRGPDFTEPEGVIFEILVLVLGAGALFLPRGRAATAAEGAVLLILGHLSVRSVRILPFFAIAAAGPAARVAGAAIRARGGRVLRGWDAAACRPGGVAATAAVALVCAFTVRTGGTLPFYDGPFGPSARYPYGAAAALAGTAPPGPPLSVLAPPEWGGFLTFYGRGALAPVIDDRNTLVGEEFYRRYLAASRPGGPWKEFSADTGADVAVLPRGSALAYSIGECGGRPAVYEDERSVVFDLTGRSGFRPGP